jgi:large subunit ribosomal protein L10
MPKTRVQKEQIVQDLTDKFNRLTSAVFVDYHGLPVNEVEELRDKLHEADVEYHVIKNRLLKIAVEKSDLNVKMEVIEGPLAAGISYSDAVAPAKILYEFAKTHEHVKILHGIVEGELVDKQNVEALAQLPSKEELLARMVGSINAPVSNFVGVLRAQVSSVVYVLQAVARSKEGASS